VTECVTSIISWSESCPGTVANAQNRGSESARRMARISRICGFQLHADIDSSERGWAERNIKAMEKESNTETLDTEGSARQSKVDTISSSP
jgi:hypothetical protein